ncbi:MAG: gamma-butyrobetaine dioxygenase [Alphaproteobacteria bacterium]|jgi:gamma-butyrobetaine dioxygenase|nr:gamma-butyrobetaine dioxygenase [Alphaproteobacteria bacterium]
MHLYKSVEIIDSGKSIMVQRADGSVARYHSTWLRDNALDPKTRNTVNRQRLITLSDIPINTYIESATLDETGKNVFLTFLPEKKKVSFSANWLETHTYDVKQDNIKGWIPKDLKIWGRNMSTNIPSVDYKSASEDKNLLLEWLKSICCYGFAKMTGGKIESGALIQIANFFGYVRETNYGKWFEVRTEIDAINLAYTNLGIEPHTDNPYRDPVPTIQILYCLENSAKGGDSAVVDGFYAATRLREENSDYFDLLTKYCLRFEFKGDKKTHLKSRRPLIELSPDGELIAIRFNNRSAAPITDVPYDIMEDYYKAYRAFADIINDQTMAVKFKLNPGDCFVLDNTRVLHARTAYSDSGSRWLQGCYADKDGLLSKISTM